MNLTDNVVQLRKLQMWIWANKRWKIWQKTNICGENFTVKHWTIITSNLETSCGDCRPDQRPESSQPDRRPGWERLNGANLGIWAGGSWQGQGTAVGWDESFISSGPPAVWMFDAKGYSGEPELIWDRSDYASHLHLITPQHSEGAAHPLDRPRSILVLGGRERDFWLVFITELLCDTKPDLKRGRDPGCPGIIIDTVGRSDNSPLWSLVWSGVSQWNPH